MCRWQLHERKRPINVLNLQCGELLWRGRVQLLHLRGGQVSASKRPGLVQRLRPGHVQWQRRPFLHELCRGQVRPKHRGHRVLRLPLGRVWRCAGLDHRRVQRPVPCGLLRGHSRANYGHMLRAVRVWNVRVHGGARGVHVHGAVRCGALRPGHVCAHRVRLRRRLCSGLLLPRGLLRRHAGAVPRGILLPHGLWRAHSMRLPL